MKALMLTGGVIVALGVAAAFLSRGEITRYLKIRSM